MTHYTVNYKGYAGDAKRAKAVNDCFEYVTEKRRLPLIRVVREAPSLEVLEFWLGVMPGISGYPVTALAETYAPELLEI